MNAPIIETWSKIRRWYERNLPAHHFTFEKGASVKEIRTTEKCLRIHFPAQIRDFYLSCNGLHGCGLSYFGQVCSLEEMVTIRERWNEYVSQGSDWPPWPDKPDQGLKRIWNQFRIPLADNIDGNYVFADLDPTEHGTVGQVFRFDRMAGPELKLGNSMNEWLERFLHDLNRGWYLYDADAESLIPQDEW